MKKYLMTGIAALALCAGFTSCSHDIDSYSPEEIQQLEAQKIQKTYKAAFEQYIGGKVASNQTWGFSGSFAASRTRGSQPDANKWADDGYKAPRELSEGQKTRVMAYFQANPYLTYVDPEYTDFFVQQVYKGYTSPGAISAEIYQPTDTNNDPVVGSDHMDHLTFGENQDGTAKDHDYNYNHGRYSTENASDPNGTPRDNVQNWPGVTYLNDNGNGTHQDHIMLMLGSSTESVGFQDSNGSLVHLDCCANASAAVIDAWALAHEDSLKTIGKFGETVTDEWQRSFVGLDYEQQTIDELYAGNTAKALDFCDGNSQYILYNGVVYAKNDFANFELKDPSNNAVQYIKDDVSNMGLAEYIKYTKSDNTIGNVTKDAYNYKLTKDQFKTLYNVDITNSEAGIYNLDMILGYIYESALPTQNNGNWVKNIGGRDYVFSDWIVTLTKATKTDIPTPPTNADLRVMAEDLTNGTADEDFDFNDIVFDVYFGAADKAKVIIKAAGGTLPLRIARVANPSSDADWSEVHDLFAEVNPGKNCTNKMINTHGTDSDQSANVQRQSLDGLTCPQFTLPFAVQSNADAKNILIQVYKGGNWVEITSEQGEPAAKFAVPHNYGWMKERTSIKAVNESFTQWCQGNSDLIWVGGINE
jgi:hypothetical protein